MTIGKRDDDGNFTISKGLLAGILLTVVGSLAGGGFTMGVLFNTVANQATNNKEFQHDIVARIERDESSSQTSDHERSTLMSDINQRLARIESVLAYAVTNLPGAPKK